MDLVPLFCWWQRTVCIFLFHERVFHSQNMRLFCLRLSSTNEQSERPFRSHLSVWSLRLLRDHFRLRQQFKDALIYAHNTQQHSGIASCSFPFVQGQSSPTLAHKARPVCKLRCAPSGWYLHWKHLVAIRVKAASRKLWEAKAWYKRCLDALLRFTHDKISANFLAFVKAVKLYRSADIVSDIRHFLFAAVDPLTTPAKRSKTFVAKIFSKLCRNHAYHAHQWQLSIEMFFA